MFFRCTVSALPALAFAALLMVLALPLRGALAQDTPPVVPPTGENPNEIKTLAAALPLLGWDSKTQGVLLAVAPEAVTWQLPSKGDPLANDDALAEPLLAPRPGYPLNASFVARHFSRELVGLPTVTVLAPTTMRRLVLPQKPYDPYTDLSNDDALLLLEATLTPAQWTKIGSADGLGMGDLTAKQQPFFLALMPENARVFRPKPDSPDAANAASNVEVPSTALTDSQRQNLRVHLFRSAALYLFAKSGAPINADVFHDAPQAPPLQLTTANDPHADSAELDGIRVQIPNRLKPGDLDLKAPKFAVWVPVEGVKTVGDLIQAVKTKTGVELYADTRLARLSVTLIAGEAPRLSARDILEALCWALSATYRKVGPTAEHPGDAAYVLTYDREGLFPLEGRILWWALRGDSELQELKEQAMRAISEQNVTQYVSFTPGSLMAPTPEALAAFESASPIPVSSLTPVQQEQMKTGLSALATDPNVTGKGSPQTDCVGLSITYRAEFRIPGLGIVQTNASIGKHNSPLVESEAYQLALSKPLPGKNVILAVAAPHDAAEANALMATAAKRGIRQVWIEATESNGTPLADCVAAGKAQHIPVGALVSLMSAAPGSVPRPLQTIDVFGETGSESATAILKGGTIFNLENDQASPLTSLDDYLDPARPETLAQIQRRAAPLAAISGLAALALRETTVPGYSWGAASDTYTFAGMSFGYSTENRLAFLRAHGFDPIDVNLDLWLTLPVPFFGGDGSGSIADEQQRNAMDMQETITAWRALLAKQQVDMLKHLHTDLSASAPHLPIYLSPDGKDYAKDENDAYQLWDDPNDVPKIRMTDDEVTASPALRQRRAPIVFYRHAQFAKVNDEDPAFAHEITEAGIIAARLHNLLVAEPEGPKNLPVTVVLDLTSMPVAEALPLIGGVFLPAP